jgi:hypothetical protein
MMSGIIYFNDGPLEGLSWTFPKELHDGELVWYPVRENNENIMHAYRLKLMPSGAFEAHLEEGDPIE